MNHPKSTAAVASTSKNASKNGSTASTQSSPETAVTDTTVTTSAAPVVETPAWKNVPAAIKAKLFLAYKVKTAALETAEAAWLAQKAILVAEQSKTVEAIATAAKGETRFSLDGVTVSLRRRKNSETFYFSRSNESKIEVIDTSAA